MEPFWLGSTHAISGHPLYLIVDVPAIALAPGVAVANYTIR